MPINLGKAKSLTSGGETLFEKDLITDDAFAIVTHEQTVQRAVDCVVDPTLQMETPQPDKTTPTTSLSFLINLPDNRRLTSITFQANIATTDAVLNIRRAGEPFWQKTLGVLGAGSETTFDLTGVGFVPIDLIDATAYVVTVLSQSGATITLDGDPGGDPFYKWEYHTTTFEPMVNDRTLGDAIGDNTASDQREVDFAGQTLKSGTNGLNLGDASSFQNGGNCVFVTEKVQDESSALVRHIFNAEKAFDRVIDVAGFLSNVAVFTVDADTLTNPSFAFAPFADFRMVDMQLRSAGVQTNVEISIVEDVSGIEVWKGITASIPASGTFKIVFSDTSTGSVPIDIFDALDYTLSISSQDGDVLLLGETAPDAPWMTISVYPFTDEPIALESELPLDPLSQTFYVDLGTSATTRDGSINAPFISVTEALAAIGTPVAALQHALRIVSGNYAESFTLPPFTHLLGDCNDPQATKFATVTIDDVGSYSVRWVDINTLVYDTSAAGVGRTNFIAECCSFPGNFNPVGRGAGADVITVSNFRIVDDINGSDVQIIINDCNPVNFIGNLTIDATAIASPVTENGFTAMMELNNCNFEDGSTFQANGDSTNTTLWRVKNSKSPTIVTLSDGDNVTIEHDANSFENEFISISGTPTVTPLDKVEFIDMGPNVVFVTSESDFGTVVPATRIDVLPNTAFYLKSATITQTLPFLIPDGSSMFITALDRSNTLSYTHASAAQFQGNDVALSIVDINFDGNSTATLFDITGGILSLKFPNFNRYDDLGIVRNLVDFFAPGIFFDVITEGLTLLDCSSATITDMLALGLDGNTFNMFTVQGPRTGDDGDIQINGNIFNNDAFSTFVRIEPDFPNTHHISIGSNNVLMPGQTFDTTGATGTFTVVADAAVASTTINSVTDSSGTARFNFTVGPTMFVEQQVIIVGFVTNTDYNGTFIITTVGVGFFEVDVIDFGTDEASGSFTSNSVTMTDTGTTLIEGDAVTIDTDASTDYDGGAMVYNVLTNTFQVSRIFTATATGAWSQAGLNQKDPRVLAINNAGGSDSKYIAAAFVNNNATATGVIVNNTFTDMVFGTGGSALISGSSIERWKLIDEVNGTFEYTGAEPFDGELIYDFTAVSSGGAQEFRFKWLIDIGAGFVDFPDAVESLIEIGSTAASVSKTQPLEAVKGDQIKPQVTRNAGTSGVITSYATINAIQ